jgi:hypothetical protein
MHVAAFLLRESSKCGTRKSAWLLVALSLPMRAAQARSRCSTSIQQVADWLEKLGLRIAKPPCVPVSHPKNQWTDMVDGGEGRHVSASANTSTTTVRPAGNATPDITTRLVPSRLDPLSMPASDFEAGAHRCC